MLYIKIHCRSDCLILICPDDIPSDKAVFPVVLRTGGIWRQGCGNNFAYVNDSHVTEMRLGII